MDYTDNTHLPDCEYVRLGEFTIEATEETVHKKIPLVALLFPTKLLTRRLKAVFVKSRKERTKQCARVR